jgi:hypothetical protein
VSLGFINFLNFTNFLGIITKKYFFTIIMGIFTLDKMVLPPKGFWLDGLIYVNIVDVYSILITNNSGAEITVVVEYESHVAGQNEIINVVIPAGQVGNLPEKSFQGYCFCFF